MDKNILIILKCDEKGLKNNDLELVKKINYLFREYRIDGILMNESETGVNELDINLDNLYIIQRKRNYSIEALTDAVCLIIEECGTNILIGTEDFLNKELFPRAAARFDSDLFTNVHQLKYNYETLILSKEENYGQVIADYSIETNSLISVTVNNLVTDLKGDLSKKRKCKTHHINSTEMDIDGMEKVVELVNERKQQKSIIDSEIIIAIGRGYQNDEEVRQIYDLAQKIGASVGATRPVVENGLIDVSCQIGQTGKTVSPRLYIALGISGAIQHITGILKSNAIIAVNRDESADIFKYADYGIVGDMFEIVKLLSDKISEGI